MNQRHAGGSDPRSRRYGPGKGPTPLSHAGRLVQHGGAVVQKSPRVSDVAEPAPWVLLKAAREQTAKLRGRLTQIGLIADDGRKRLGHIVAAEGPATGDHF